MPSKIRRILHVLFPDPTYYGWVVVVACLGCAALSAPGQSFALALYLEPIARDLAATPVEVAVVYGWATLAAAVTLPFVGLVADRTSSRAFLGSVLILMGLALFSLSRVSSLAALGAAFFALRLLAQGATGLGTLTTVLRWFEKHRARAIGVTVLGYALGEFTMPAVLLALRESLGWRGSLAVLSAAYVLVLAPAIAAVLRAPLAREAALDTARAPVQPDTSASEALRMPRFWALVALSSVIPLVLTGVLLNQVTIFSGIGWSALDLVRALQSYALAGLAGAYCMGGLLGRVPVKGGIVIAMTLLSAALVIPLGFHSMQFGVVFYGALLGAASGAMNVTSSVLWPEYFGVSSVGTIKGVVSMVRNGLTAAGAPLAAWLLARDADGSHVLVAGMGIATLAGCGALLLPRPEGVAIGTKGMGELSPRTELRAGHPQHRSRSLSPPMRGCRAPLCRLWARRTPTTDVGSIDHTQRRGYAPQPSRGMPYAGRRNVRAQHDGLTSDRPNLRRAQ